MPLIPQRAEDLPDHLKDIPERRALLLPDKYKNLAHFILESKKISERHNISLPK